jgi:hypothetical protein
MLILENSVRVVAGVFRFLVTTKISLAKHSLALQDVLIVIHHKNATSVFLIFIFLMMATARANVRKDTLVKGLVTPANAVLMIALPARECTFVIAAVQILTIDS